MPQSPVSAHSLGVARPPSADSQTHELTPVQANVASQQPDVFPEMPKDWKKGLSFNDRLKDRKNDFSEEERKAAWSEIDKIVQTYSDEMVQRWIAEMDTLLVYAGLFSAVLTAFNVESYLLLSPAAPDPVLAALTQISAQLSSFSVSDSFVNSTQYPFNRSDISASSSPVQAWTVWLNALWFSSLICSLSAASVAIMVKQWINEYNSGMSGTSRHTARLRQHRLNGLLGWGVPTVIAILPTLLQISLALFLAGILVLLWNLNRTVAIVASVLVGVLLMFTVVTTILPTFSTNCAYLSPLSSSLFYLSLPLRKLKHAIKWLAKALPSMNPTFPTIHAMQSAHVTSHPDVLDQNLFVTAYSTTRDIGILAHASTCFSDRDLRHLRELLSRIHTVNKDNGQPEGFSTHWTTLIPMDIASDMLLVGAYTSQDFDRDASGLEGMSRNYQSRAIAVTDSHRGSCALVNLAVVLFNASDRCPHFHPIVHLKQLVRQLKAVNKNEGAFSDQMRKCVIAAVATALRRRAISSLSECVLYHQVLTLCDPFTSGPSETQETSPEWMPLEHAIALAEDVFMKILQSPPLQDDINMPTFDYMESVSTIYYFVSQGRFRKWTSERMLHAFMDYLRRHNVDHLSDAERDSWIKGLADIAKKREHRDKDAA